MKHVSKTNFVNYVLNAISASLRATSFTHHLQIIKKKRFMKVDVLAVEYVCAKRIVLIKCKPAADCRFKGNRLKNILCKTISSFVHNATNGILFHIVPTARR